MADNFSYKSGVQLLRAAPVGSGVVIEIGDHLKIASGKMIVVNGTTDNLVFAGTAVEAHRAVDPSGEITVSWRNALAVFEPQLDTPTDIVIGDSLASDGSAQVVTKNATDPIATAVESKLQATSIRLVYRLPATSGGLNFVGDAS